MQESGNCFKFGKENGRLVSDVNAG